MPKSNLELEERLSSLPQQIALKKEKQQVSKSNIRAAWNTALAAVADISGEEDPSAMAHTPYVPITIQGESWSFELIRVLNGLSLEDTVVYCYAYDSHDNNPIKIFSLTYEQATWLDQPVTPKNFVTIKLLTARIKDQLLSG